jgi:hypothetical protein
MLTLLNFSRTLGSCVCICSHFFRIALAENSRMLRQTVHGWLKVCRERGGEREGESEGESEGERGWLQVCTSVC